MNKKYTDFLKLSEKQDGVFYLGHASILASLNQKKILFDPILLARPYGDAWTFFPDQIIDKRFYDVDCIVVSHIHQDHYDVDLLKKIDGRIPIVIIGGRPSFEADLKTNGINNVTIIEPEKITEILQGIFIYGVNHESNGIDSSCIVFNESFCIYHGNDNFLSMHSLNKFINVNSKIDVACIPYAYINWYPFLLEYDLDNLHLKERESARLVEMYMNHCIDSAKLLNPQVVIPFGANLLLDDGNAFSDINMSVKTPLEFCDYVNNHFSDMQGVISAMHAGDYCCKLNGLIVSEIDGRFSKDSYRKNANDFLRSRAQIPKNLNFETVNIDKFLDNLNEKLKSSDISLSQIIRVELEYLNESIFIEIDCNKLQAQRVSRFTTVDNYHHFKLDHVASGHWLNGKRFEEIIGMRRFKLKRVPNIYSKELIRMATTII